MKKIVILVTAILALTACTKDMQQIDSTENETLQTIAVYVEPFNMDVDTKTSISISTEGGKETAVISWSEDDQIGIYPVDTDALAGQTSQQILFKINGSGESSSATFTGTGWGLVTNGDYKYFSYYPYSAAAKYNEASVSFTDNLNQSANASTAHLGCNNYLYAPQIQPTDAASAAFTFKHLGAVVEFEVTLPNDVWAKKFTRMQVTASEAVFTTSGCYDPSSATSTVAPTITDNVYTDKLNLTFNGGVGFTPDAAGKIHAYFLIAPAAVNGKTLSIKLWSEDNVPYIASKTPTKDIASSNYKIYECNATIKPTDTATDLSEGGTANCYIVPEYGKYEFLANVRGNGVDPIPGDSEGPSIDMTGCTAAVIWETVNTNNTTAVGTIINNSTITIKGNYIEFTATGAQGNALIALKNGDDIVWSWHIWSTSADLEALKQTYPNGAGVMMDRNLGALSATPGNGLTLGFHYQWGRPFPITGGSATSAGSFTATRMVTTNQSIWVEEETDATKGTLAYSAANPTHFIYASASNYYKGQTSGLVSGNWLWTADGESGYTAADMPAFWGPSKTMYDPSPVGWKVPAGGGTGVWATAEFSESNFIVNGTGRVFTSTSAYYPFAGYRGKSNTAQSGDLNYVGNYGYCWSYTVDDVNGYAYYLYYGQFSGKVNPTERLVRAYGHSVRPCHE